MAEPSSSGRLPEPLRAQILEETRKLARYLGFGLPPTAEVFGPDSYARLVAASSDVEVGDHLREIGSPFYLVVLRGRFVARAHRGSVRGSIATLVWSPADEYRHWGLVQHEPSAMSRLGRGRTISLE